MGRTGKVRTAPQEIELSSLDDLHREMMVLCDKIRGLGKLLGRASSDQTGCLDLDSESVGLGEILQSEASEIERIAGQISEWAVRVK